MDRLNVGGCEISTPSAFIGGGGASAATALVVKAGASILKPDTSAWGGEEAIWT
jgi:hypothetical protein